ncbi:hypothetical protein HO100_01760 [Corynebacterium ulcerans]|nr:hypothetical protein [Corynebacterium ulcerans]NOL61520.1 hypothetical protein [Corynebacterium ulcerans]NON16255.1 hypothetical protein [Corynebacterium ulcerans]
MNCPSAVTPVGQYGDQDIGLVIHHRYGRLMMHLARMDTLPVDTNRTES